MPFTLSHPAAAVPLRRLGLVLSALVVGSMSPDFHYFLPYLDDGRSGHTLTGLVLLDLPLGLAALWVFHAFLKLPLLSLLPRSHRAALLPFAGRFRFLPPRRLLLILVSLAVGGLTHLGWDGFTHGDGWALPLFPVLERPVMDVAGHSWELYRVIQHASTIVGAVLLIGWCFAWYGRTTARSRPPDRRVDLPGTSPIMILLAAGAALFLSGLDAAVDARYLSGLHKLMWFLREWATGALVLLALETLLFGAWWHLREAGKPR
jgi:hypothetical protein